jgi:hypothetical protein
MYQYLKAAHDIAHSLALENRQNETLCLYEIAEAHGTRSVLVHLAHTSSTYTDLIALRPLGQLLSFSIAAMDRGVEMTMAGRAFASASASGVPCIFRTNAIWRCSLQYGCAMAAAKKMI